MPGKVFLQLFHDNSQQEEFHNYYYSSIIRFPLTLNTF